MFSELTVFICDDNNRFADISISLCSRGKHCDAVVSVFLESCQCCLICWSTHYFGYWAAIRFLFVGDCVIHYNAILIVCWNFAPLNGNAGRACILPHYISWGSIRCCKEGLKTFVRGSEVNKEKSHTYGHSWPTADA